MSPGSRTAKIINKPKEIPTTTFKQTNNKDKTNKVNTDPSLNYPIFQTTSKSPEKSKSKKAEKVSVEKDFLQNTSFTLTSTVSKVPSTEGMNIDTLKPKTKWLAKREQEMLKQAKLQTRTRIEFNVAPQQEKHNSEAYKNPLKDTPLLEKEIASVQKKLTRTALTSELTTNRINHIASHPLQTVPCPADCRAKQSMLKCNANANVTEQIQNSPKPLTEACAIRLKVQDVSVLQTKTCVWDHIKQGLYKRRRDSVPVLFPIVSAHKVSFTKPVNTSESVLNPHTGNEGRINAAVKNSPVQFPIFQRPVEDVLSSRLQNMSIMGYSPEMATGYGGTFFFSSQSEMSSNENLLVRCQSASKPTPQHQGRVSSLVTVHFTATVVYIKKIT